MQFIFRLRPMCIGTQDWSLLMQMNSDIREEDAVRFSSLLFGFEDRTQKTLKDYEYPAPDQPHIAGNNIGMGVVDVITAKLMAKACPEYAYVNALTSLVCTGCKIPMTLQSDEDAIKACIRMCVGIDRSKVRLIHIRDTLHIARIEVSEAMIEEVRRNPELEILDEPHELVFDESGNLQSNF